MKPEKQRIAIAEACGWTDVKGTKGVHPKARFKGCGYADDWIALPDYLSDLNAIHEAEKVFLKMETLCFWETYSNRLTTSLGCTDIFHATAAQRARAFLETLGLWDNGSA
jgi:hypothetical protein